MEWIYIEVLNVRSHDKNQLSPVSFDSLSVLYKIFFFFVFRKNMIYNIFKYIFSEFQWILFILDFPAFKGKNTTLASTFQIQSFEKCTAGTFNFSALHCSTSMDDFPFFYFSNLVFPQIHRCCFSLLNFPFFEFQRVLRFPMSRFSNLGKQPCFSIFILLF